MGERLSINLLDLDRLARLAYERMILPYTIKKAIQLGQAVGDVGIEFNCPLLQAAAICDMIRSEDRKSGDCPTRIYLHNGRYWKKLDDGAVLTRLVDGKAQLHPKIFDVPAIAAVAPPAPSVLKLGRRNAAL